MRRNGRGVVGAMQLPMVERDRGALALRRWGRGYAARCDVPWDGAAICGHAVSGHWLDAVQGAVESACVVGEYAGSNPDARARALALESMFHGAHPDDIRQALFSQGYSHVIPQFGELLAEGQAENVGFLPLLAAAAPLASGLLSKFGGGGAAPAAAAPGGGGMPAMGVPAGAGGGAILPIIVKF